MIFKQISPRCEKPAAAVFLDRDGTINVDKGYLHEIGGWQWEKGAIGAICKLKAAGYRIIVISNQAGIARGLYSADDVHKLHEFVNAELKKHATSIDAFYFCPHHPDFGGGCDCRKPSAAMILSAAEKMNIDLKKSWMVGDKIIDIEAAKSANVRPILVRTGHGADEEKLMEPWATAVDNLGAAAEIILK